jgi:hypothetical protein
VGQSAWRGVERTRSSWTTHGRIWRRTKARAGSESSWSRATVGRTRAESGERELMQAGRRSGTDDAAGAGRGPDKERRFHGRVEEGRG